MGYTYIAIGGVAKAPDVVIRSVLDAIRNTVLDAGVHLHVLGVARFSLLGDYQLTNVISCDSAATLMQAFKSAKANYHRPDQQHYTCVRIPPVGLGNDLETSPKVHKHKKLKELKEVWEERVKISKADKNNASLKKGCEEGRIAFEEKRRALADLELKALAAVRLYAQQEKELDDIMDDLFRYEEEFDKGSKFLDLYRRTLADRPWEQCPCTICQQIGIEVVIMRGNNRNRRRGFHNTFVFYNEFKRRLGRKD